MALLRWYTLVSPKEEFPDMSPTQPWFSGFDKLMTRRRQSRKALFMTRAEARSSHPPKLTSSTVKRQTIRFQASSAGPTTLTTETVCNMLVVATSATTAYSLISTFRLHRVEIWGPMASNLSPVTVSVEYSGTGANCVGPSAIHSDTSMGSNCPAHVNVGPPPLSTAATWQAYASGGSALNLATLNFPTGAIVDLDVEFVLRDTAVASSAITVAAATTGVLYRRAPDSAGYLVPVSHVTI